MSKRTAASSQSQASTTARRLGVASTIATVVGLVLWWPWQGSPSTLFAAALTLGLAATAAYTLFEALPRELPRWIARWALQVVAVGLVTSSALFAMHLVVPGKSHDWLLLAFATVLVAPWTALVAVVRQKDAFARDRELAFALERSELERQALGARLNLLQAQVAPHFLFNTLANVQALVDARSPQAPAVLRSLVAYLRAAVPRLDEPAVTIERELELVRPYLDLMQMRMPDRLRSSWNVDAAALQVHCPPTTLLTLVENAVRHGIDPSEEGGEIRIDIERRRTADGGRGERCVLRVSDTGVGLHSSAIASGPGTGLNALRERLRLAFGDAAQLRMTSGGRGTTVEVDLPAER
jgi:hypothetical protein